MTPAPLPGSFSPPPATQTPQPYSLPTIAFVLSLLGLCLCLPGPIGFVLGVIALIRIGKEPHLSGKGFAIAAVVIPIFLVPMAGIYAAIAIPNFIRFQSRAKQAECKVNLKALAVAEQAYFAEHSSYTTSFEALNFAPDATRYTYLLGDNVRRASIDAPIDAHVAQTLSDHAVVTGVLDESFVAACVGNVDTDATLDVWTIDEHAALETIVDDVTE